MKKIIIIGIIIAAFIVWSIVDQPCQPPPRDGIGVERDCYPEPRWIKWTTEINNWHDPNPGFNDMRYVGQLQRILDQCFNGKYDTLIERNWRNDTHHIDNNNCEWQENERSFEYRLVDDKEQIQRVLDSCPLFCPKDDFENDDGEPLIINVTRLPEPANGQDECCLLLEVLESCDCFAGFGEEACKLPGLSWRNDTHHIDNNTCEWLITSAEKCKSDLSPNDQFYYYDDELCELIPKDIDLD